MNPKDLTLDELLRHENQAVRLKAQMLLSEFEKGNLIVSQPRHSTVPRNKPHSSIPVSRPFSTMPSRR